jgi:AcrR family transcriptional regulator
MRKLLDAAMIAFDKRGYHATRVNDVVDIAKTSHGTFYLYFSNKEDLLRALVTEAATEAQHLYDALNTSPELGRHAAVGRRARVDPGLLGTVDSLRPAVPGLDRPGHHRPRAHRRHPPDLHRDVRRAGPADQHRGIGAHHRPQAAGMAVLAMLDRFHYLREFVGQPVDDIAIDTMTTMVYRALFDGSP